MSDDEDVYVKGPESRPVLPVAQFDSYDPSCPPVTGEEYLRRVQLEASELPDIVEADLKELDLPAKDVMPLAASQLPPLRPDDHFIQLPNIPPIEWQDFQMDLLSSSRMQISEYREHGASNPRAFPPFKNNKKWWMDYIFGREGDDEFSTSSEDEDEDTEERKTSETSQRHSEDLNNHVDVDESTCDQITKRSPPHPPRPSELLHLSQGDLFEMLRCFHRLMKEQFSLGSHLTQWIFSVLILLEKPLTSGILSCMRSVSREASHIRFRAVARYLKDHASESLNSKMFEHLSGHHNPDRDDHHQSADLEIQEIVDCNLLIYSIGRYFGQKDLLDS